MSGGTEVVAVYVEERARTYGFELCTGLTLVTRGVGSAAELEAAPTVPLPQTRDLLLASALAERGGSLTLQLLVKGGPATDPLHWDAVSLLPGAGPILRVRHPVEAIFFHGPHFGDRFGIASAALDALRRGGVPLVSLCCAGASVCVVVAAGKGEAAVAWLRTAFQGPPETSPTRARGGGAP